MYPATSFDDVDGSLVEFPEKRRQLEVLPKPEKVLVDDGEISTIESLPEHLKSEDWYFVRNLDTAVGIGLHRLAISWRYLNKS